MLGQVLETSIGFNWDDGYETTQSGVGNLGEFGKLCPCAGF
jgi:hypothetical protein